MKKKKVFLGGTCNDSTWRDQFISLLDEDTVSWFNPVVKDWNEEAQAKEIKERETCDYCLYVITPLMTGVYSIAEVVDDAHKRPKKTLFCVQDVDITGADEDEVKFNKHQMKSLDQVGKMVEGLGAKYFKSLEDVAKFLNKNSKLLERVG